MVERSIQSDLFSRGQTMDSDGGHLAIVSPLPKGNEKEELFGMGRLRAELNQAREVVEPLSFYLFLFLMKSNLLGRKILEQQIPWYDTYHRTMVQIEWCVTRQVWALPVQVVCAGLYCTVLVLAL